MTGLAITISDDGRGFDPRTPRLGFGVTGMYERAGG
jgi:signal transduction histidine kinase